MTAKEIVIRRTGMSEDDAEFYISMAEQRVIDYLHLPSDADLTPYTLPIADIAVLYYQRDESNKNLAATLGYTTVSFSEGSVSESHGTMTGASVNSTYDDAILDVLNGINDESAGMVVFL